MHIEVVIADFGNETYENRLGYCYDAIAIQTEPTIYKATKGTIIISKDTNKDKVPYEVKIQLQNLKFDSPYFNLFFIENLSMTESVGLYCG